MLNVYRSHSFISLISVFLVLIFISSPAIASKSHSDSSKLKKNDSSKIKWIDASDLLIEGKGWKKTSALYSRLPLKFKSVVRPAVWSLSRYSAGIAVRFTAVNTKFIKARWSVKRNYCYLPHMTPLGVSGLDLYVKLNGKWVWAGIGKPHRCKDNEATLVRQPPNKKFEYMLYLPLYNITTELKLGFQPGAQVERPPSRGKPVVVYGTSIVQGCSASRAGMNWPAIVGRRLDLPVVNLGFSGNGTTDPEFADILAEIEASAYIIDCLPNMSKMTSKEICNRTVFLVRKLRNKQPDTPIILVEDRTYAFPNLQGKKRVNHRREGLQKAYSQLLEDKINNLWYVEGDKLLGDGNEATVDGSHPTDLGMYRISNVIEKTLKKALKVSKVAN